MKTSDSGTQDGFSGQQGEDSGFSATNDSDRRGDTTAMVSSNAGAGWCAWLDCSPVWPS